ncbi:MAG: PilZ domain-containing protein [candidate division FCPU426 bacterium]
MGEERRRSLRVKPAFRVRTEVLPEAGDIHMAVFADIQNLSEDGIGLRSPLKLKVNDRITIFLPTLENREPLEVRGMVRWVRNAGPLMYQYGMKFEASSKAREHALRTEVKAVMDSYYRQKAIELEEH